MTRSKPESTFRQLKQAPKEAFRPARKPRTSLSSARAPKKAASSGRTSPSTAKGGESAEEDAGDESAPHDEGAAAFARVRVEIEAVPREQVRRLSIYVPNATVLVLGALPKLLALRDAMRATFLAPPFPLLDKLRDYALAAAYAHSRVLPRDAGETHLRALVNEATPLRERLLSSAETLTKFDLLDARQVAAIRQGTGHVNTAQGLSALAALFREAGPAVVSKTALTKADLKRAGELSTRLLDALGQRQSGADGSGDPGEADDRLGKAYELLARAYGECRRVVAFLRWHEGDADLIAPPLGHSRRRGRRPQVDEPDAPEPDPSAPDPIDPSDGEVDEG